MRSLNRVELIGRLGADPDLRYTQSGEAVATISLATNEQWTDRTTGEPREETEWHRCVLWRRLAEIAQQYLRKGSRIYAAGQIKTRKWQDQSGADRYTTEIRVRDLMMLDGQHDSAPAPRQQPQQYQPPPAAARPTSGPAYPYQQNGYTQAPPAQRPSQQPSQHTSQQASQHQHPSPQQAAPAAAGAPAPQPIDQIPFDDDIPF